MTIADTRTREPDEVAVALCIYGDDLDPEQLSLLLGKPPTHAHRRGDASGQRSVPFKTGAWILELRRTGQVDLDALFLELFDGLPSDRSAWERLAQQFELRLDFALHTDAGAGFYVSSETLQQMAARQCALNLSIYAYGGSDA